MIITATTGVIYTLDVTAPTIGEAPTMRVIITHVDLGTAGAWKTELEIGEVQLVDDGFRSYAAGESIAKSVGDIDEYPRIIHATIDEVVQSLVDFHVENSARLNAGRPELLTREGVEAQA